VFDVGGNIGIFSLFAHAHAPGARIYTFEPAPPLFARLRANLALNGATARAFNHGVAEAERTARFTFYPNSSGMSSFHADVEEERDVLRTMFDRQRDEGVAGMDDLMEYADELLDERLRAVTMECRLRPLSAIIREEGVERIDFLKIDVQKAELEVLRGIDDDDWHRIRQIVIEVHDLDGRLDEVTELLRGRGYRVAVEQDEAVRGSVLYNLFAVRASGDVAPDPSARAVFLFPGVGDQYAGMGRGLYDAEPVFRAEVDRCADLLRPHLGFDLRDELFATDDVAPPDGLDLRRLVGREPLSNAAARVSRTEVAQPAAFVVGYALARLWESWGVSPVALAGHSLGEYTAACVAGVFGLEEALELVALRARAIQALPGGAMLAVSLAPSAVEPWLGANVALAAVNAPDLCVLAGSHEAITRVEAEIREAGHVTRRLAATHAFHSPLMQPVAEEVAALVARMELSPPRIPILSNVTGTWLTAAEATDPGYWARHLVATVQFARGAAELLKEPGRVLVEVGPGGSLGAFVWQQAAASGADLPRLIASLPHAAENTAEPAFIRDALERFRAPDAPATAKRDEPRPAAPAQAATPIADFPGGTEAALAAIWTELLGVEPHPEDDFFLAGGHSLLATRLIARVHEVFGVKMRLRTVFQTRTVAGMALWIDEARKPGE
jgi:FkbM family methyltransferase